MTPEELEEENLKLRRFSRALFYNVRATAQRCVQKDGVKCAKECAKKGAIAVRCSTTCEPLPGGACKRMVTTYLIYNL